MPDHQYLNPFFALPRTGALFFSGSAFYVGFIDPLVRSSLPNPRDQLTHWAAMFKWTKVIMPTIAIATSVSTLKAYQVSKEPLWIMGGLAMMSLFPYTAIFLKRTIQVLQHEDKYAGTQIDITRRDGVMTFIKRWVRLHRVRVLISLAAAFIFYIAEGESSDGQTTIKIDADIKIQ